MNTEPLRAWAGGTFLAVRPPGPPLPEPHPKPLVQCRDAADDEIPASARRLAVKAEAAGWKVWTTYSRGTTLMANGKPGKVVDSIAVRMMLGRSRYACGVWTDGAFEAGYVKSVLSGLHRCSSRELNATVSEVQE